MLYDKVLESHRKNDCRTERIVNSSSFVASERVVMTQADIFDFMRFIFDCGQVRSTSLSAFSFCIMPVITLTAFICQT